MRIALDAMGGDFAPEPNIQGALAAVQQDPDLQIVLVGDTDILESTLAETSADQKQIEIKHASEFIRMDEKPTEALRKKPDNSLSCCWKMMANREVDAVVSAGNTGAVVAAGLRTRLFLKGVKRPGIAVVLPTIKGPAVLMDVGANPAARPEHLYQYGVMGSIYARDFLGIEQPSVGLMNIGSEDGKGNELYRESHTYIMNSPLKDCYVGNVEGRGLYHGDANVLVCEGFVGNVVLKVSEGMAEFLMQSISKEILSSLNTEQDLAKKAFSNLARKYQYREAGGAPLLGIDGISIICHGSSDAHSITNALKVATTFKHRQINNQIVSELAKTNGSLV